MKLRQFVAASLTDVLKGITDAQLDDDVGELVSKGAIGGLNFPESSGVIHQARLVATTMKFDIAVTVESTAGGGTGAGFNIGVVQGKLDGDLSERNEGISRIQFAVPLLLPASEKTRSKNSK